MSESVLTVSTSLDGKAVSTLTLTRPKIPEMPEGWVAVPATTGGIMWTDYLNLPDGSYLEVRWRLSAHGPVPKRRLVCPKCGKVYANGAGLAAHHRSKHKESR